MNKASEREMANVSQWTKRWGHLFSEGWLIWAKGTRGKKEDPRSPEVVLSL
jgi:hypothetical protein